MEKPGTKRRAKGNTIGDSLTPFHKSCKQNIKNILDGKIVKALYE